MLKEKAEEIDNHKKGMDKLRKEKVKMEKEHEAQIKDLKEQLSKSFADVKRNCDENTRLKEEKRTLLGIHQVNSDLHKELRKIREASNATETDEVIDIEN